MSITLSGVINIGWGVSDRPFVQPGWDGKGKERKGGKEGNDLKSWSSWLKEREVMLSSS